MLLVSPALSCTLGVACAPSNAPAVAVFPDFAAPVAVPTAAIPTDDLASVRFGHPTPTVGAAWTVEVRGSSRSVDDPHNPGAEQVAEYQSEYLVEVLAVAGPAPSRVRLTFARNVHLFQGRATPTEIDGKAYLVDSRAPHVRDASGGGAAVAETERVLDVFPDLGTRARIDEVLPSDPMRIGDRHDDLAAAILRVVHPRAWTLREGRSTLARVVQDHAVFTLSIDAASENGLRMVVAGEARVRLTDSRLSELTLSGQYEKQSSGAAEPPGTFEMRRTVR